MKILKNKQVINRHAEYCTKELEKSFAEMKSGLKAMNSRKNNAEEQKSNLEDRVMKTTASGQQTDIQTKETKAIKAIKKIYKRLTG